MTKITDSPLPLSYLCIAIHERIIVHSLLLYFTKLGFNVCFADLTQVREALLIYVQVFRPMTCKTPRWRFLKSLLRNLPPEEFLAALEQTPRARLLDVRTGKELEGGVLPNAIHLDFLAEDFLDRLEGLDKDDFFFVYCRTGRRSLRVCTYMRNSGFRHVFNLDGGFGDITINK